MTTGQAQAYETILVERKGRTALLTLNRPKALNALNLKVAAEAERAGLVSRVVAADDLLGEALAVAETVAGMSLPVAMMAKEAVGRAFETTLTEGVRFERRLFHAVFATADQKVGMGAFVDKRPPEFRHR
ncbi:enoyl-CoA hydratase-related protein [Streptomyces avermitilis]